MVPLAHRGECGRWHIVLLSDDEREDLDFVLSRAREAREIVVVRERRRQWFKTWWGIGSIVMAVAVGFTDIFANLIRAFHP